MVREINHKFDRLNVRYDYLDFEIKQKISQTPISFFFNKILKHYILAFFLHMKKCEKFGQKNELNR